MSFTSFSTQQIRALILDIDGVIWKGGQPIGDLPAIFSAIQARNLKFIFATNNAVRTIPQFIERIAALGIPITPNQIVNSAMSVAHLLAQRFPNGGPVYIIGEDGIRQALANQGFFHAEQNVLAVIVSLDRKISYEKLTRATLLIRAGAPFYGSNPDRTYPTPEGLTPGAGTLLAAIEAATDTTPIIAGKPQPALFELALQRLGVERSQALVVGDRLETDILGGQRAGLPTALVLSGVSTAEQAANCQPAPDLVAPSLGDLIEQL
jgi:4-nitrophenyl phosphatase